METKTQHPFQPPRRVSVDSCSNGGGSGSGGGGAIIHNNLCHSGSKRGSNSGFAAEADGVTHQANKRARVVSSLDGSCELLTTLLHQIRVGDAKVGATALRELYSRFLYNNENDEMNDGIAITPEAVVECGGATVIGLALPRNLPSVDFQIIAMTVLFRLLESVAAATATHHTWGTRVQLLEATALMPNVVAAIHAFPHNATLCCVALRLLHQLQVMGYYAREAHSNENMIVLSVEMTIYCMRRHVDDKRLLMHGCHVLLSLLVTAEKIMQEQHDGVVRMMMKRQPWVDCGAVQLLEQFLAESCGKAQQLDGQRLCETGQLVLQKIHSLPL